MELQELRNKIARAQQVYFNTEGDVMIVEDSVYEGWKNELRIACPNDPLLTKIGAPVPASSKAKKVRHIHPMGSLNNAMNEVEFMKWNQGIQAATEAWQEKGVNALYNLSFKMDGCSCALFYENGVLIDAVTRGNGEIGESILANALRMHDVPMFVTLPNGRPFNGSVRGEVMLFNEDWKKVDPDQLSNPRNLGNGIARRLDGKDSEYLHFVAFRLYAPGGVPMVVENQSPTESGLLKSLEVLGFSPVTNWGRLSPERVLEIYYFMMNGTTPRSSDEYLTRRFDLPFLIDGLVLKAESLALQERMDVDTPLLPKSMIAFKFLPCKGQTKLKGVKLTVGHTGAIIPTADLEPVLMDGVTVTSASLYNFNEIDMLDVAVGDTVEVERCGDVIPKVVGVVSRPADRVPIVRPTACPVTGGPVGYKKNVDGKPSVHLYSLSADNPAAKKGKILRWLSSLEILHLGDQGVEKCYEAGVITDVSHIYEVAKEWMPKGPCGAMCYHEPERVQNFYNVMGRKIADKVIKEIRAKRDLTLSEFLGSLGIDGLGKRRVLLIQQACPGKFDDLANWTSPVQLLNYAAEAGVPNLALSISDQIFANIPLIERLLLHGIKIVADEKSAPVMAGALTFCITGALSQKKQVFYDMMVKAGHCYEEDYRKGLSYLVVASKDSTSSKTKKALKDGVPIITEAELLDMLK